MTIDEFESMIKIGDICNIRYLFFSITQFEILFRYQGLLETKLHFEAIHGKWSVKIPIELIISVENFQNMKIINFEALGY